MKRGKYPSVRGFAVLGLLIALLFSFSAPVANADSLDNMIPTCPKGDPSCKGQDAALFNQYGVSKYSFQTLTEKKSFWNISGKANDSINSMYDHVLSMLFIAGAQITRFFIFIAREAFTFGYMNAFIEGVADMIKNITGISNGSIGKGLWDSMFGVFASVTLLYMLWQMIRFRFLETIQTGVQFILALLVAITFFSQSGPILKFINDATTELGDAMYSSLAKPGGLGGTTSDGITAVSNQVWMELVMRPYTMLQFDDPTAFEKDEKTVRAVLDTEPYSDERVAALEKAEKTYPAVAKIRSDEQMVILLCNAIFGLIILGLLSFWAIATIFIRLKFLVHAVFMAISLLASLLPGREAGLSVVRSQFIKLIGLGLQTTITFFFLDLSIVMGHMAFNLVYKTGAGWFVAMLLDAIVIFVVFKYRNDIGAVFSKAAGAIPMPQKAKSTVLDAVQRNVTRSLYHKAGAVVGGMFNRKETAAEGVPSTFNPNSISKANENLNAATTASMQLRYQREKSAAEEVAAETGQPVQYTPFVQRVNENLRSGAKNPFRGMDKDWKEEKTRLKGIQDDGGDVKQAILSQGITDDMNDQQAAAVLYTNENAIREASFYMVNRPKEALNQVKRAGTLNKNRKLETTVDDFVVLQLFQRYKVEYKQAIDHASATGEPVQHTAFVKSMESRFKAAGLHSTPAVNKAMSSRNGRIASAHAFKNMPEFVKTRDDLLRANEAFIRSTVPEDVQNPQETATTPISLVGPIRTPSLSLGAPSPRLSLNAPSTRMIAPFSATSMPAATISRDVPLNVKTNLNPNYDIDMSRVNYKGDLSEKIRHAKDELSRSVPTDQSGEWVQVDAKTQVLVNLKQKVTTEVSSDLHTVSKELEVMRKANGRKLVEATVNDQNKEIQNKVTKSARTTRNLKKKKIDND